MYQVQQQSPNKTGGCFRCQEMGHWAKDCPKSPITRSPIPLNRSPISVPSSTSDYPSTHCRCGAGFCEIRVSNSENNPNRKYYCCPGKFENHCEYFKWCDMLKKEEILEVQPKKFPICGCGAGVCRVMIEESGPTAGRSSFVCPIKKGYGACDFKQWMDDDSELPLDNLSPEAEMAIDASAVVMRALDFSSEEDQVQMEYGLDRSSDVAHGISSGSPGLHLHSVANNISGYALAPELPSENASGSPGLHLHSVANNISGNALAPELPSENIELLLRMGDSQAENVEASVTGVATTIQDSISLGFNPLNMPEDKSPSESSLNLLEVPKQSVVKDKQNEGIFEVLEKLSLCLQKDFITVSESTGPKNHEGVLKKHSTFAPLDYLRVDYGLFHLQAIEYIKQATAHACIEQAIKDDATSRELLDHYKKEKTRFEEIVRSFCEAGKAYMASHERLISFREKVSRVREMLVELEDEVVCCEVENANDKENLLQITKSMSECKESMQNAYQEVEDAFKLL